MKQILYNSVRFYRTSIKKDLKLTQHLTDILIGLILGDLYAERKTTRNNTRMQFNQTAKHSRYIEHLYNLFIDYVGSKPKSYITSGGLIHMKNKTYSSIKFYTLSLSCFNMFRELFYDDKGIKIVPDKLDKLLTVRGLAYWYIDDGYKAGNEFVLCTESFSKAENYRLAKILIDNFNISSSVRSYNNKYRLFILSSSRENFITLVKPHIIPFFCYKLGL
jgi:hypothetical protein